MYYCEACATKAKIKKPFWQTYTTCDLCGKHAIVYDHSASYELLKNAPLFVNPVFIPKDGRVKSVRDEKKAARALKPVNAL